MLDPDAETQIEVCQNLWHTLFIYGSAAVSNGTRIGL